VQPSFLNLKVLHFMRRLCPGLYLAAFCFLAMSCRQGIKTGSGGSDYSPDNGELQIDGSRLAYKIEGEGLPCLVIGSSIYYPRTFSRAMREHLRMYFVDMKWFAPAYAPEDLEKVDIASITGDVEEIRRKLGLEKPLIIGHSIHGTIAAEYVKRYPDNVAGLVVIGSPALWGSEAYRQKAEALWASASPERKALQEENWGKLQEIDRLTGVEEAAARYNNTSPQYWYDMHYDAGWLWQGMTVHSEVTQHLFTRVFSGYDMFEPPVRIPVPMLVAMGRYDYVIPYTLWQAQYESVPDFNFILFDKSGHTPQLEESEHFDRELLKWLETKKMLGNRSER
jgi:proline iminopeptidase